ncbi:hypothetical protein GCM10009127_13080 [Alteraurantiacibacter aestuarii]|uniref:Uncharacterized protein n=1 Tax=Alteraurantiacibacter aestuarii TaxID=650004 RepID=A0A844ZKN8_9SPHN|nr:hypothetical protein [Alteraurantiacibacter aestuarii]MXO88103.1 hypothetical protein [Alteraurantiacibacter aestuarii]
MTAPFLTVWTLSSGSADTLKYGLFDNGGLIEVCQWDEGSGGWSTALAFDTENGTGHSPPINAINLPGVVGFQFNSGINGMPNLGGSTFPQVPDPGLPHGYNGPYDFDEDDGAKSWAFSRLIQACGYPASFVRVTKKIGDAGNCCAYFRFPFRVPLLGNETGQSNYRHGAQSLPATIFDPDLLFEVATCGTVGLSQSGVRRRLASAAARAELATPAMRQLPYIAGTFRHQNNKLDLDGFACNAGGVAMLDGFASETGASDGHALNDEWIPSKSIRERQAVSLADGLWWAQKNKSFDHGDFPDLDDMIAGLAANPASNSRPVLAALAPASPHQNPVPDVDPVIGLLELAGLKTAKVDVPIASDALDGKARPFHYMHTRMVSDGGWTGLEWRRWVMLECTPDVRSPALIRVRQGEWDRQGNASNHDASRTCQHSTIWIEGLTDYHAADLWSRRVAEALREGNRQFADRSDFSLLPDLVGFVEPDAEGLVAPGKWVLQLNASEDWSDPVTLGPAQCQPQFAPGFVNTACLFKASDAVDRNGYFSSPLPVAGAQKLELAQLKFLSLGNHRGKTLAVDAIGSIDAGEKYLASWKLGTGWQLDEATDLSFLSSSRTTAKQQADTTSDAIRIGGLEIVQPVLDGDQSKFTISPARIAQRDRWSYEIDGAIRLSALAVNVVGQDGYAVPLELQPLVFASPLLGQASIVLRDRIASDQASRLIEIALEPHAGPLTEQAGPLTEQALPDEIDVTVIDASPMSIATVVTSRPGRASDTNAIVARWNPGEDRWRLIWAGATQMPEILLHLPPQGVAEAWERSAGYLPPDQIGHDSRVPARLPPPTRLRIESEERARQPLAPWNIRQILSETDSDLPGARMIEIVQLEALYGLEISRTLTSGIRIAELGGWRGNPREPQLSNERGRDMAWRKSVLAASTRLAIYDARHEQDVQAGLVIEDVNYGLRSKDRGGRYVQPTKSDWPQPNWWTAGEQGGILGGALAGFEIDEMIRALLRDSRNGHGEVERLMLSALGAWTRQKARFNNDLTLITPELEMGRVSEVRFERKGRIGALHHRAKHVIVYRRSMLPGLQFAGKGQQHHLGRPIVRKVEEYIEIEQPLRTYPDTVGATSLNSGPILGARFRSKRIPVEGSWAQALPRPKGSGPKGYSIPLWKRGLEADIYPRPVAEILIATDPERAEPEPAGRRIEDPERLNFYTITTVFGADGTPGDPSGNIDEWPLVYGLDFVDRSLDDPLSGGKLRNCNFSNPARPGAMLPPAQVTAPGLERFTLRLEPGPGVNLTYGRGEKPMMADLNTVTIMRAEKAPGAVPDDTIAKVEEVPHLANTIAELARDPSQNDPDALKGKLKAEVLKLKNLLPGKEQFTQMCAWVHRPSEELAQAESWLKNRTGQLPTKAQWDARADKTIRPVQELRRKIAALTPFDSFVRRKLSPIADEAREQVDALLGQFDRLKAEIETQINAARNVLESEAAELRGKAKILRTEIAVQGADIQAFLPRLRDEFGTRSVDLRARFEAALASADAGLLRAGSQLEANAKKIAKSVPKASLLLRGVAEQIGQQRVAMLDNGRVLSDRISQTTSQMDLLLADIASASGDGIEDLKAEALVILDQADSLLDLGKEPLKLVVDRLDALQEEIDRQGEEIRTKVLSDCEGAATAITDQLDIALAAISPPLDEATGKVLTQLDQIESQYEDATAYPQDLIGEVTGKLGELKAELASARTQVDTVSTEICAALASANEFLDALLALGKDAVADICAKIDAITDPVELKEKAEKLVLALRTGTDQIRQGVEDLIDGEFDPAKPQTLGEAVSLNLLRAAGAPPIVEQLVFNREKIAYHFERQYKEVVVTPVTAFVDQADRALRGVGLALPTLAIGDRLLAPADKIVKNLARESQDLLDEVKFKAKDVLKDFAGIKSMLPHVELDEKFAKAVKISHGYDQKRNSAWMQASIEYKSSRADLFRQEAFALTAEKLRLDAVARYERGLNGGEDRQVKASLVSDWVLEMGGIRVVRIRDAAIRYTPESGTSFDIDPGKIEFPGAMKLMTDLVSTMNGGEDDPLKIMIAQDENGRPIGLRSTYDLPPTIITIGAATALNVGMGVHLDLLIRDDFEIRTFAYFGRKASPFALIITWLGGGGYLEAEATHRPDTGKTTLAVTVSIGVTAGAGFSLGPLRGSVIVYAGFEAHYVSRGSAARLNISALIVINGSVTAWGFVTVSLTVRMQITYNGSKMLGHGYVKVQVKISRFYKKKFSRSFTYKLT